MISGRAMEPSESEDGPLWRTVKRQLYRSEVSHVKRLVGEGLIQQNRLMWEEVASLKQILAEFQEKNDELDRGMRQQMGLRDTQQRDMLRRQAQLVMEDVRAQAEVAGHILEDVMPEIRAQQLREFLQGKGAKQRGEGSPPDTPSTRPSTSSACSSTAEPLARVEGLPLGRQLGLDELVIVAEGIREGLEAEQEALLAAISEQMELLEAEEARQGSARRGEPSTAELQLFMHKLQDIATSPGLRALSLSTLSSGRGEAGWAARPITGGSNVRRLRALIAERRQLPPDMASLGALPEAGDTRANFCSEALAKPEAAKKPSFDPFFDDPFA